MPKYLKRTAITGQYGVNVVERIVLKMGYKWLAGNASLDTGIDGEIEVRDPQTEEAKNLVLRVQIKTRADLDADSHGSFRYTCKQDDLDYWMQGNAPVVLVIVKIPEDTAWWISVKDYFKDPARLKTRQVQFDKTRDRLDEHAAVPFRELAQTIDDGVYFAPAGRDEGLISNLLEVSRLPNELWMAETEFRSGSELQEQLRQSAEYPPREWFVKDGRIYSPHNLREFPWNQVCDIGTVELIDIAEWRDSPSPETRRDFARFLNQCLRTRAAQIGLRWSAEELCFYFKATKDLSTRSVTYRSLSSDASRDVFRRYAKKTAVDETAYYRHCGFESNFRRFDQTWYLEITPRYVFTSDGVDLHPYREEYQAKIKTIEGSAAVRGLVVMFAALLKRDDASLFKTPYPFLGFGELAEAALHVGIDDRDWSAVDELGSRSAHDEMPDTPLFDQ